MAFPPLAGAGRLLRLRGFRNLTEEEARDLDPWMRFTPMLQAVLFGLCTATGSTPVLLGLAGILTLAMVLPRHPFDSLYHGLVRPLEQSPKLPYSPPRRKMVFAIGVAWLLATAWAFSSGHAGWGYLLGGTMTASTALLAATQICIPSLILSAVTEFFRHPLQSFTSRR